MSEEKKKIEQTSSKIDSADHVFYSDDSVFVCYETCNNLQFIELTFSSPFLRILYFNGHSCFNFFQCVLLGMWHKKETVTGLLSTMSEEIK